MSVGMHKICMSGCKPKRERGFTPIIDIDNCLSMCYESGCVSKTFIRISGNMPLLALKIPREFLPFGLFIYFRYQHHHLSQDEKKKSISFGQYFHEINFHCRLSMHTVAKA